MANNTNVQILSKEATEEILGEELCFLIAFGKNGQKTHFFRYDAEINHETFNPNDFIDVSFKAIPEDCCHEFQPVGVMRAAKRCLVGGQMMTCNGFPCPTSA
jgi:hypothetical protein